MCPPLCHALENRIFKGRSCADRLTALLDSVQLQILLLAKLNDMVVTEQYQFKLTMMYMYTCS